MAYLLLLLTVLFWAGNFVLAKSLVGVLPPFSMAALRWSFALLLLFPFAYQGVRKDWRLLLAHWKIVTVLSFFGVAVFNSFIYLGVQKTTATNAALLQSAIPIMVLLVCVLFFSEKLSKKQLLGVLCSCLGVLVIISEGQLSSILQLQLNSGDLWVLGAVSSWTIYSVLLRYKPAGVSGVSLLFANVLLGNLFIYPFVYWELQTGDSYAFEITQDIVFSVLYLAIFPSLLSYLFWNRAVAEVGATKASLFIHLLPVFGTLLAAIFLDEKPQSFHFAGIGLIFIGIYLAIITDILLRIKKTRHN